MTDFHTGINSALPLAVYTRKQEKCQMFALDAGVPFSEATMVTTGTKAALNCGGMELAWREWKRRPTLDQAWNIWKLYWSIAFTKLHDIHCMTSTEGAFANQIVAEAEQAEMMARSLDNLANAVIQKNDTVEKLVSANECLAKALADANAAIARLCLPGATAPTPGTATPACAASSTPPAWDPHGYCWTHGWKVKLGHSSTTCTHCKEGHDATATHTHTNNGSGLNKAWTGPKT